MGALLGVPPMGAVLMICIPSSKLGGGGPTHGCSLICIPSSRLGGGSHPAGIEPQSPAGSEQRDLIPKPTPLLRILAVLSSSPSTQQHRVLPQIPPYSAADGRPSPFSSSSAPRAGGGDGAAWGGASGRLLLLWAVMLSFFSSFFLATAEAADLKPILAPKAQNAGA